VHNFNLIFSLIAFSGLTVAPVLAQKPTVSKSLPAGSAIIDRSVQATGGAAWEKLRAYTFKGTIALPAQGVKGEFELTVKVPGKMLMRQKFASLGETMEGFDGKTGWAKDSSKGMRSLTDAEIATMKQQVGLKLRPGRWKQFYPGAESLGIVKVAQADAYRVRLKPNTGDAETRYFDVKSGLEVRADMVAESPQGKIPVEVYTSDYHTVNGVKIPYKLRQVVGPTEIVMQITEVKFNPPVADTEFARPK
jgi:zinc protease